MKKLFTLLALSFVFFTFKAIAQTTNCNAGFDVSITNLSVHFIPGTTTDPNINHHIWKFGDGTTSSEISPTHVYAAAGTYTVRHTFYQKNTTGQLGCETSVEKRIVLTTQSECHLQASFNYQFDPLNHKKVFFVNQSTPATAITSIKWDFGDGTSSTSLNPEHIYTHPGSYKVCIRVTSGTNCVKEFCKTIEIKDTEIKCADISKFNIIRSTGNCLEFKYVPSIQNPNWKYVWTFGDGSGSNQMSPAHAYPRAGNYTVTLTVHKSSTCTSSSHKIVETGSCMPCKDAQVKFEYRKESVNSNKYFFHAVSKQTILSQRWTITKLNVSGPGTVTLTTNNPDFLFTTPGDYRVCLRAVLAGNCVKEYCEVIHISVPRSECIISSYPNPAHNIVNFSVDLLQANTIRVYIFNSLNTLVKHFDKKGVTGNNIITTNIERLTPGVYTIKVIYGDKVCYSKFHKI